MRGFLGVSFGLALTTLLGAQALQEGTRALALRPGAEQRVALVIGNAAYRDHPLRNPVNDARAMAAKLRELGFQVVERENLVQKQTGAALREFRSRLTPGSVALFFYAGHGLQVDGTNYLPSVDAEIVTEEDVPAQSIEVNKVLSLMDAQKTRLNLVFLDACRNNPFTRGFRSVGGGLARLTPPSGTILSFATRPGNVAADGTGAHGLYTEYLLKAMDEPGVVIELALKEVLSGVKLASRGQQEPWFEGGIEGDFCFRPAAPVQAAAPEGSAMELAFWHSVEASRDPRDFQAYLDRYPAGQFAPLARNRLTTLTPSGVGTATAPAAPAASGMPAVPGETWRSPKAGLEFVRIPPGSFQMGSRDWASNQDERTVHPVTLTRAFFLQRTNVTVGQFRAFVQATGYRTEAERNGGGFLWVNGQNAFRRDPKAVWNNPDLAVQETCPVVCVSWNDAQAYCRWLSETEGTAFRLPTEAEWEYACRAGTTGERYGDLEKVAWYWPSSINGHSGPHPVAQKLPNGFGLFDILGNAADWCQDWYGPYGSGEQVDPAGTPGGAARVFRGGGWIAHAANCRAAGRHHGEPSYTQTGLGFRLARD